MMTSLYDIQQFHMTSEVRKQILLCIQALGSTIQALGSTIQALGSTPPICNPLG